jgi:hypothetical protein
MSLARFSSLELQEEVFKYIYLSQFEPQEPTTEYWVTLSRQQRLAAQCEVGLLCIKATLPVFEAALREIAAAVRGTDKALRGADAVVRGTAGKWRAVAGKWRGVALDGTDKCSTDLGGLRVLWIVHKVLENRVENYHDVIARSDLISERKHRTPADWWKFCGRATIPIDAFRSYIYWNNIFIATGTRSSWLKSILGRFRHMIENLLDDCLVLTEVFTAFLG